MHDQQMAVELSSNGTLGLSDLIVRQLGGDNGNFTPSSVLRNDGTLEQVKALVKQAKLSTQPSTANIGDIGNVDNTNPFSVLSSSTKASEHSNDSITRIPFVVSRKPVEETGVNFLTPTFAEPKDFVSALTESAKVVQAKLGVPFQVVIAQAALETGWGQKIIKDQQGSSSHNLFNIKADNRWAGEQIQKDTLEFENGTMVKKSAPFRAYESLSESFNDYVDFLSSNDRYQDALQKSSDVEQFLHGLQKAGYATDPEYANKIMATLRTVTNLISK
jgi:flagellar protein FlgJ